MNGIAQLRKVLYVLNMNEHRKRTKDSTKMRMRRDVVDACRRVVINAEMEELYRHAQVTGCAANRTPSWRTCSNGGNDGT